ncbi:MAG TPA: putative S-layer protein [Candidatus Nanoarchaeia archaeon]|nr:putative S-layer protein [Candidatus Nanoarchaeia archaeon]
MVKKFQITIIVLFVLLIVSLLANAVFLYNKSLNSQSSEQNNQQSDDIYKPQLTVQETSFKCLAPYIQVGSSCCLDNNSNNFCDKDETKSQPETVNKKDYNSILCYYLRGDICTVVMLSGDYSQCPSSYFKSKNECESSSGISRGVVISALLNSDAVAGEEMIIKATLTNVGSTRTYYRITVNGYGSWASLDSISSETLSLDAGRNGDVFIKLTPNGDASGNQEFTILVIFNSETREQRISIPIN